MCVRLRSTQWPETPCLCLVLELFYYAQPWGLKRSPRHKARALGPDLHTCGQRSLIEC